MPSNIEIEPLDYTGIAKQYFRVGTCIPQYNCVAEKILGEMGEYFRQNQAMIVISEEDKVRSLSDYFPEVALYLRCGTKIPTDISTLASVDGHIQYFKALHIPVFYYLDDAFFSANNYAPLKILMNSDQCILATEALVEAVYNAGYRKPIHLLKTHMDIPTFDMLPAADKVMDREKFNILFTSEGRIGTVMLDKICERMSQNPEKYKDVRIVCITSGVAYIRATINRWRGFEKVYYERVPLHEYYGIFKLMDLCIAPGDPEDLNYFLPKDQQELWLASKSCVKYTIAGAAKVPCIASPYLKEYELSITPGKTGFIAKDIEEWMHYIDLLINNADIGKEIGAEARKDVIENWHIADRTKQFVDILKGKSTCLVSPKDPMPVNYPIIKIPVS